VLVALACLAALLPGLAAARILPPPPPPPREWPGETQGIPNEQLFAIHARVALEVARDARERGWNRMPTAPLDGAPPLWRAGEPVATLFYHEVYWGAVVSQYRFATACPPDADDLLDRACSSQMIMVDDMLGPTSHAVNERVEATFDPEATVAAMAAAERQFGNPQMVAPYMLPPAVAMDAWVMATAARTVVFDSRTCPALEGGFPGAVTAPVRLFPTNPRLRARVPPAVPEPPMPGRYRGPALELQGQVNGSPATVRIASSEGPPNGLLGQAIDLGKRVIQTCEPVAAAGPPFVRPPPPAQ
jgi:hypothetical protein